MSYPIVNDDMLIADENDRILIQRSYRQLLRSIKDPTEEDKRNIRMAYEMAVEAHSKQRRKSGEPYILHPIAVAQICSEEIGLGPTAIVCALLHDVVEDTEVTLVDIKEKFGDRIALIVDGLTKLDKTYESENQQAENFKKVLSTLVVDVRVVLIKMADRLHNLRTIGSMPKHKQIKIAAETSYIYSPLAHRLGLYNIKTEFQDLCMKITERDAYDEIADKLNETRRDRNAYISEFIKPLSQQLDEAGVPYRIFGRPKSIHSIWNKIKNKKIPFDQIYDLFAVRIVVDVPPKKEKATCWLVYSIVTDVYKAIPDRLKDWVTTPKANGYESLHTTVVGPDGRFVEVQIRSERMDDISERGFAAHWKYKGISDQTDVYEKWLANIRDLMDNITNDPIEFLHDFMPNLFQEEVFVYTPKGDLRMLPKGATALDFAFDIHSDVGYHCTAIKVNNAVVPMSYKLQNGDQVHIITNKTQKPSEGWLKMVVTGKARSKIRSAMKDEQRKQGELGKEAIQRKLKALKVDFEESVDVLVRYFNLHNRLELFYNVAIGNIHVHGLKGLHVENGKLVEDVVDVTENKVDKPVPKSNPNPNQDDTKPRLIINGQSADQYEYTMATCCNPVMGDDVFAYLTANQTMKIHRTTCPNATNLLANYSYRVMKAEWVSMPNRSFLAHLRLTGIDDGVGVIERLSSIISTELGLNIRSFFIDGNDGYFEGRISIVVSNVDQMKLAIRSLKSLDNITSVVRDDSV